MKKSQLAFTTHLRNLRKKWHFSQEQIAAMCGFTQEYYSKLERCKIKNPEFKTFKKLGKGLHEDYRLLIVLYLGL